jgi:hypothetical protein
VALSRVPMSVPSGPGFEDRPSDLGSPQGLVSGFGGADKVVLANRPVDAESVPGYIGAKSAVASVIVGVGAGMDDRRQLRWGDHRGGDTSNGPWRRTTGEEDGGSSPIIGEEL